jgi:hypothetical protein
MIALNRTTNTTCFDLELIVVYYRYQKVLFITVILLVFYMNIYRYNKVVSYCISKSGLSKKEWVRILLTLFCFNAVKLVVPGILLIIK